MCEYKYILRSGFITDRWSGIIEKKKYCFIRLINLFIVQNYCNEMYLIVIILYNKYLLNFVLKEPKGMFVPNKHLANWDRCNKRIK